MKYLLLTSIFLSFNIFSGETVFSDELDEFTDERLIYIGLVNDERNFDELIAIFCDDSSARMGVRKGIIISSNSTILVTFRFDKRKPIAHEFNYLSSEGILMSRDIDFMKLFLKELKNSYNVIVKIEGEDGIMRYSELKYSKKNVADFMKAASEMPPSKCNFS
tara:strand:+ start:2491 stop:2979 length:489 start_codon:yes stop_codon:yes gene_type:complete